MRVLVLGPLRIDDVTPPPRDRVVLSVLLLDADRSWRSEELADALWGNRPPASWQKVVHGCVARLRRQLGAAAIVTTTQGYRVELEADVVDAWEFVSLVARARELLDLGEPDPAAHQLRLAAALWRGQPFEDLDEWVPGLIERERLVGLRGDAEELAVESALRAGRHEEVLGSADALVAEQPGREHRWALLARAEYQAGRQVEGLRTLRRARAYLVAEYGVDPGPELLDLEEAILHQDARLAATRPPETSPLCPWPGLVPYQLMDAERFFGRESAIAGAQEVLRRSGVLTVVGPSGCGKSSLVRAGLAAKLVHAGRRVVVRTPGIHPVDALTGLPERDGDVIVVDQVEEALTVCRDPTERSRFFDRLVEVSGQAPLIVAVRADRLGDMSAHAGLSRLVERGLLLLGTMDEEDIRAAILRPAAQAGLLVEPGLVDLLVVETAGEPGALPLLSHALRRTWEEREGRTLTVTAYRRTGGIRGAVARSAEQLYASVGVGDQQAIRDLMLRLVVSTPAGDPVRSPVPRRTVVVDEGHARLVDLLVDARLLTTDGDQVALAHESLTQAWPRLRSWLDDDVEGQRVLRHLVIATDSWESMGRPPSELYRGLRLETALEWRDRTRPTLTESEGAFLAASQELAIAEREDERERARRTARSNRRLRGLLGVAGVLMACALAGVGLAVVAADRARDSAAAAEAARGRALAVAALETLPDDRSRALLLAVEASRLDDSTTTRRALLTSLAGGEVFPRTLIPTSAEEYTALGVGGAIAVAKRGDGRLDVVDLETRRVVADGVQGPASPAGGLDVSPDGRLVASAGAGTPSLLVWDTQAEEAIDPGVDDHRTHQVRFSPDGATLAVGGVDGRVQLLDLDAPAGAAMLDSGVRSEIAALAFTPDGSRLLATTLGLGGEARLVAWDVSARRRVAGPVGIGQELVPSLTALGDDLVASGGSSVRVWRVADLAPVDDLDFDGLVVTDLAQGADGTLVATSPDGITVYRGLAAGEPESIQLSAAGAGAGFTADGRTLVTAGTTGDLSTWVVGRVSDLGAALTPSGPGFVTASPDGATVAVWARGRGVRLVDWEGSPLRELPGLEQASFSGLSFSPDGSGLATLTCADEPDPAAEGPSPCRGVVRTWEADTGRLLAGPTPVARVNALAESGVAYSADGRFVLVAGYDDAVHVLDRDTLRPARPPLVPTDTASAAGAVGVAVASGRARDGAVLVAVTGALGQAAVWRLDGASAVEVGALTGSVRAVEFAPDGRMVVVHEDGRVVLRHASSPEGAGGTSLDAVEAPTALSFSNTGIAVTSSALGAEVWDLDAAVSLSGPLAAARSAVSPDGRWLILGALGLADAGDVVRRFTLDPAAWPAEACSRAGRNLTEEEWNLYFPRGDAWRATCREWPFG